MSWHAFSLTAGIVFLLIALGHLFRVLLGVPFIVQGISVPMWPSIVAALIAGFLAYQGFHYSGKTGGSQ